MSTENAQTEFDLSEFETHVTDADEEHLIETIAESIERLRDQIDDDTLDAIFRAEPGQYTMRSDFTRDQLDPEPLTQNRVIEPILDALGYENYGTEAGDFSAERGEQADYAISLRDIDSVDSTRLLIEAEPINKQLRNRGHGLDQVESWLSQREFESDFGFATDGLRWIFVRYDPDAYTHSIIKEVDLRPVFLTLFENATTEQRAPASVLSEEHRRLVSTLIRTFEYGNFIAIIDDARQVLKQKQEEITDEFYEDYIRLVFGVEEDADDRQWSDKGPFKIGHQGVYAARVDAKKGNQTDPITFKNCKVVANSMREGAALFEWESESGPGIVRNCRITNHLDRPVFRGLSPSAPAATNIMVDQCLIGGNSSAAVMEIEGRPQSMIQRTCITTRDAGPEDINGAQIGSAVSFGQCTGASGLAAPEKVGSGGNISSLPAPSYNGTGAGGAGGARRTTKTYSKPTSSTHGCGRQPGRVSARGLPRRSVPAVPAAAQQQGRLPAHRRESR